MWRGAMLIAIIWTQCVKTKTIPNATPVTILRQVMKVGSKFKYVFDFGDNWQFQCKVLSEKPWDAPSPGDTLLDSYALFSAR